MCKTLDICFVWFVVFFHNVNAVFKRKKKKE